MKEMTNRELTMLGRDLKMAKILVLKKYGFTNKEIANIMGIGESTVRNLINTAENK